MGALHTPDVSLVFPEERDQTWLCLWCSLLAVRFGRSCHGLCTLYLWERVWIKIIKLIFYNVFSGMEVSPVAPQTLRSTPSNKAQSDRS